MPELLTFQSFWKVLRAESDADTLIVSQTLNIGCRRETAAVVTKDMDNKTMLLYSVNTDIRNI